MRYFLSDSASTGNGANDGTTDGSSTETQNEPTALSYKELKEKNGDTKLTMLDSSFPDDQVFTVSKENGNEIISVEAQKYDSATGGVIKEGLIRIDYNSLTPDRNFGAPYLTYDKTKFQTVLVDNPLITAIGYKKDAQGNETQVTMFYIRDKGWFEKMDLNKNDVPRVTEESAPLAVASFYLQLKESLESAGLDRLPGTGDWVISSLLVTDENKTDMGFQERLVAQHPGQLAISELCAKVNVGGQDHLLNFVVFGTNDPNRPNKLVIRLALDQFSLPILEDGVITEDKKNNLRVDLNNILALSNPDERATGIVLFTDLKPEFKGSLFAEQSLFDQRTVITDNPLTLDQETDGKFTVTPVQLWSAPEASIMDRPEPLGQIGPDGKLIREIVYYPADGNNGLYKLLGPSWFVMLISMK